MQVIENTQFRAEINEKGAELTHLINKAGNFDYIWNNDLWPKHAPVLFPAIGRSEKDSYLLNGQEYQMPQHGFAGDQLFDVAANSGQSLTLSLTDNTATKKLFPFKFRLDVTFTVTETGIKLNFDVNNLDDQTLAFSIGSHPAFNVPIDGDATFDDYQLEFQPKNLDLKQFEIIKTPAPYRDGKIIPLTAADKSTIQLNHDMFEAGLVIIENDGINSVKLSSQKSDHSIELSLNDFRYVCLWTKEGANAPFLCIEPFQGLPDISGQESELLEKEANVTLDAGKQASYGYEMTLN